eukprot:NODE_6807_length_307_cov_221.972868_g5648_i0.p1 GENE.NODE_6807_length_307_cov_221.972868_g5648_i0~~NODE_6807_length_307_cov_221.972868_g5648_i0.p1  ORF type:complete len:80 (-),score=14.74 NODE_6807_length_307_cov_221.972868_g5648_i0:68-283(-)
MVGNEASVAGCEQRVETKWTDGCPEQTKPMLSLFVQGDCVLHRRSMSPAATSHHARLSCLFPLEGSKTKTK